MKLQKNLRFLLLVGVFFPTVIYSQWSNVAPSLLGGYSSDYGAALMNRNGICWAGYHNLFKSLDSGNTWQDVNLDLGYDFVTNIYFSDENNGIVSSLDNGIFVTTDQGKNWSNVLTISTCFGVTFGSAPNHMVACNRDNDGGNVYVSHDFGKTWTKKSLEVYYGSVYEVTFHPATGNILALSRSITPRKSHIFVSTDNGDHWSQQLGQVDLDCYSFSFHECKQNIVYIANEDHNEQPDGLSEIYVSSDYGNSFSSPYSSPSPSLAGAVATSRDAAFVPRSNTGSILRSIDSGKTWISIGGPSVKEDCRSICAIDENIILAADRQGNIWKTTNSGGYPVIINPDLSQAAAIELSAARIINDSIGAVIWMPIIMKRSKAVPAFDMVVHYEDGALTYKGSLNVGLKSLDIPGEQWSGRAKVHFEPADLPPTTDSVIGYAKFAFYPYEIQCSNLWYDSLQFKNMSPCEAMPIGTDTARGIIGSYEGCGQTAGSVSEETDLAVTFTLHPNPAMGSVSIISNEEFPFAHIKIMSALGDKVMEANGRIGARPLDISIESLASGMYYVVIETPEIRKIIPLAHIR
jgi:photosystem II stability/assembly factor-like uncharacterized protein